VILVNLSNETVTIEDGERVAQLVFCQVEQVQLLEVEALNESTRGAGGFGSTGVK
jgi:dUTP pyrophosphatase